MLASVVNLLFVGVMLFSLVQVSLFASFTVKKTTERITTATGIFIIILLQ